MERQAGKEPIREAIRRLNKDLAEDLEAVWNQASRIIADAQKSPDGHGQGMQHCLCVEDNLSKLIPDEQKGRELNVTELFILSSVACLHDNGRRGPLTDDHGVTGATDVRENCATYKLDKMQAHMTSLIIEAHTNPRNRLYKLPKRHVIDSEPIQLRNLAAIFCLADVLDCSAKRVLRGATEDKLVTQFRRQVSGWDFDPNDKDTILIKAIPEDFAAEEKLQEGFKYIDRCEIEPIAVQLREAGYPYRIRPWVDDTYLEKVATTVVTQARTLPGLDFYDELDEGLFKGRDAEITRLRQNVLSETPVSLLTGRSGIGKTSLIHAGLFPRLRRTGWKFVRCYPTVNDPVAQIVRDIWRQLLTDEPLPRSILETLQQVSNRHNSTRVLIVLDQFENALTAQRADLSEIERALFAITAQRFINLRLLIACQSEVHAELTDFFQKASTSMRDIPECPLIPLSRDGGKKALEALFASLQIGIAPILAADSVSLMDLILNEIERQGQGYYPPYLQMVAVTLADGARTRDNVVTLELYNELGGASAIIGRFLLNQLTGFGSRREQAENVLKALVGEAGLVRQRSFKTLQKDVGLDAVSLRDILNVMKTKRLIHPLEGEQYEVVHPYLARLVEQQLVKDEERELKRLQERLFSKSREYASTKDFLSPTDLARLYLLRDRVTFDDLEASLVMHCCLAGIGPGWYWFRDSSPEECFPIIRDALSHPYEILRKNALELWASLKREEALPEVKQMLKDSRPSVVRSAIWAIARFKTYQHLPEIRHLLRHESWAVREAAIRAVGELEIRELLPELRVFIKPPWDWYWQIRWAAVEVIAKVTGRDVLPELQQMLKHSNWAVRGAAVVSIARMEGHQAVHLIIDKLGDKDWAVRKAAVISLLELKDEESLNKIKDMINDKDWEVREAAVAALAALEGKKALPELTSLFRTGDAHVRRAAIRLIAEMEGKQAIGLIVKSLYDRHAIIRIAAVNILTEIDGEESLVRLMKMLKSGEEELTAVVSKGIAKLGSEKDVMELAHIVANVAFGKWAAAANDALVRLDRRLYFPFEPAVREFFGDK